MPERAITQYKIAYFSMEIGLAPEIPTYSGGLGILAGDTLKAGADLGVPMVGITLLSEKGYFTQHIDRETGQQTESETEWNLHEHLHEPFPARAKVRIEGREVQVQAWQHKIVGASGDEVLVLFLDTNLEENDPQDRELTRRLYGGDHDYRLKQEIVLGIGGIRILKEVGFSGLNRYHMNEGHAALLALDLFRDLALTSSCPLNDFDACLTKISKDVRTKCVFTTHTPVVAGHDKFKYDVVQRVMGDIVPVELLQKLAGKDAMNMTVLAMNLSHYVNSVARQHQHVSEHLFPGYHFSSITNGVHSVTWTSPEMKEVFDKHLENWRKDSFDLRNALRIPEGDIVHAHANCKRRLLAKVNKEYGVDLKENVFTIGFARRAATYKRADLLFQDITRLKKIAEERPLQVIFAGKAHPADTAGKDLIKKIFWHIGELKDYVEIVYLENYDIDLAKLLIPGVDVWLNTPMRPLEASGTSGMKAAHNGVPNISIQDGWWLEGHIEGVTGWEIGPVPTEQNEHDNDSPSDAEELYDKLQYIILPTYYDQAHKWTQVMRNSIAFNASFFNTHRMMQQYVLHAYLI